MFKSLIDDCAIVWMHTQCLGHPITLVVFIQLVPVLRTSELPNKKLKEIWMVSDFRPCCIHPPALLLPLSAHTKRCVPGGCIRITGVATNQAASHELNGWILSYGVVSMQPCRVPRATRPCPCKIIQLRQFIAALHLVGVVQHNPLAPVVLASLGSTGKTPVPRLAVSRARAFITLA